MLKFMVLLPCLAWAGAWVFGRNPSIRLGFQALAGFWTIAAVFALLILYTVPEDMTSPLFFLHLMLLRLPYLLIGAAPLLAVVFALLGGANAPEAPQRREEVFTAAKTAAGVGGKVAGGIIATFIKAAIKEAKKS